MKMTLGCVSCSVRQIEHVLEQSALDGAEKMRCMQELLADLASIDMELSPPAVAAAFHAKIKARLGDDDPYREMKRAGTSLALGFYPEIKKRVTSSPDPLMAALKAAIAGNIIDYGARRGASDGEVFESIERAFNEPVDDAFARMFRDDASRARGILYAGDNAGEIVFDRLLLEELGPARVTFAVRGGPIINDATMEDARASGLEGMVRLVSTGTMIPGIDGNASSPEFVEALAAADMIIFKGQGNLETVIDGELDGFVRKGARMYFLLKVKCDYVASRLGRRLHDIAFLARTV
jgi:damage-control phosphatase, subfamily I